MRAYVINLVRDVERRAHIDAQLRGIEHEFVDAVDGHALTAEQRAQLDTPPWISPGGLGCALSHRNAYGRILEDGERFGLVLEDDAIVPDDFLALLGPMPSLLKSADIALLHYRSHKPGRLGGGPTLAPGFRLREPLDDQSLVSTVGYVIGREVAERMLALHPVVLDADDWGAFQDRQVIDRVWCVHPQPISARNDLESTVGYRNWRVVPKWLRVWNRERIQRRMTRFRIV
jgi:glycosyl transferase family 25